MEEDLPTSQCSFLLLCLLKPPLALVQTRPSGPQAHRHSASLVGTKGAMYAMFLETTLSPSLPLQTSLQPDFKDTGASWSPA